MDLKVTVESQWMKDMQEALGGVTPEVVVQEFFTIGSWVVKERRMSRVIVSATQDGKDPLRLDMPSISQIVPNKQ